MAWLRLPPRSRLSSSSASFHSPLSSSPRALVAVSTSTTLRRAVRTAPRKRSGICTLVFAPSSSRELHGSASNQALFGSRS